MLNINVEKNGTEVTVYIEGRMDTNSSPQVTEEVSKNADGADKMIIDLEKLEYISSAGLRCFVMADQQMQTKGGELNVRNIPKPIMDIFEMTGFDNMLTII